MQNARLISLAALACGTLAVGSASASQLIHIKAGCVACHTVDRQLVGPSYKAISAKYKGKPLSETIPYLTQRVRKGGPGNWGPIPMAPNDVSKISAAELKAVLEWSLKQ